MSKQHKQKNNQNNNQQLKEQKAEAFEFVQKINAILAKIREANVGMMETTPPSDEPGKMAITKVIFPPEGGVFTYFDKEEHPAKGFCYGETVETVDEVKKTMMAFLTGLFDSLSKNKLRTILFVLFFRKQFEAMAKRLIVQLDYRIRRVRQKPDKYCVCAREFYRVFNSMAIWYPAYKLEIDSFRNIWCMILEYDDAYRYTLQDVLPEFNKDAARKDIVKEIKKMLDLALQRDHRGLFIKFSQIRKMLFLLNLKKDMREMVERFFLEIDLDKIKMDEDDKYHCKYKDNYNWDHVDNFEPIDYEKRARDKKIEEDKKVEEEKDISV